MLNKKRGQVTPFIILGIIIVIFAVLFIYFGKPEVSKPTIISTAQLDPVKDYVEDCIRISVEDSLDKLNTYGGYLGESAYFYKDCEGITFVVYNGIDQFNRNIDTKIETQLVNYLKNDCNLDKFEEQFGNIEAGEPEPSVEIGLSNIQINVKYPIRFEKGNVLLEDFSLIYNTDFGAVYGLVNDVLEGYKSEGDGYGINDFNDKLNTDYQEYNDKITSPPEGSLLSDKICVIGLGSIDYKVFSLSYDDGQIFRFGVTMESF